jgi:ribosome-associated translation inhibitor RaiA
VAPPSARINFTDENGPKGGVGVRCAITVPVPRRAPVHVEHVAEMHGTAFDGALDTLEHRLAQGRRREREAGRRPKKYYVAKRALSEGLPGSRQTV